jgi:small subunit ribosomal protein S7
VFIDALENSGPREETVRLKYGGINVPKAVDTAPMRRVDQALMFITQGAEKASFKSKKSVESALAEELMAAAKGDVKSYSVGKKDEKERVAKAAR